MTDKSKYIILNILFLATWTPSFRSTVNGRRFWHRASVTTLFCFFAARHRRLPANQSGFIFVRGVLLIHLTFSGPVMRQSKRRSVTTPQLVGARARTSVTPFLLRCASPPSSTRWLNRANTSSHSSRKTRSLLRLSSYLTGRPPILKRYQRHSYSGKPCL